MNKQHLLFFLLFCFSFPSIFAQSSFGAELVSYQRFGEGLMVTRAKIPPVSGLVSNFFFYNREDLPWQGNEWYEYDWEIRGAYPNNGWSQIRVRPQPGVALRDAPVNINTTTNIGNSLLHWILIRKGNQYIYDIRKDFNINNYNYNNASAHGGNSVSLIAGGPRVYTTGGSVAHIPTSKRLDYSLGVTAFDNGFSGPLPGPSYSADFVIDFTRFYGFSGNNLNTNPQWQDEFNYLDQGKWQVANWTFADTRFTSNNIRFEDGKMILTANRNNGAGGNSNQNLALNGTASQSSTANNGNASRAIDNNTSGVWNQNSVTHTNNATNSWWQVDLGQDSDLDRIQLYNRTNCCTSRLSNFSVSVLDANDKVVWTRYYSAPPSPSLTINLDAVGRKVRVNLDGILSLAEVKVFGTSENSGNSGNAGNSGSSGNAGNTSDKVVQIRKRNASGFALDGGNGASNGQNVYLWSQNQNNINQQWVEINRGGGYYTYRKQDTNHCIDGGNGGSNNQNVYIWTCNSNNQNQHWQKVDMGGGHYKLVKRNAPYAMDGGNGGSKGQNVKLWDSSSNHQNLQWQISEIAGVTPRSRVESGYSFFDAAQESPRTIGLTWLVDDNRAPIQFEIEHQKANGDFEVVGIVAANASDVEVYNFVHASPVIGENIYRIKAIFRGYDSKYLVPQKVMIEANAGHSMVFPNPSSGELFVDLTDYLEQKVTIVLTDLSGKVYLTNNFDSDHRQIVDLDISTFQNGFYILHVKGDNKRATSQKISLIQTY